MHLEAEYGIAAHWIYKRGRRVDKAWEAWVKEVMDWRARVDGALDAFIQNADTSAFAEAAASTKQVDAPTAPADHENLADDCCPICVLIHLAGTIAPAETPPLPLPGMFFRLRHETAVAFDLTAQPRVLFQARAPPLA